MRWRILTRMPAYAVFLRAANVGGRNVFRPAQVASTLAHLGVVNVGAAGTFLVREKITAAELRREILGQLKFQPDLAIVPAPKILELVRSDPFRGAKLSKDARAWVAVLCARPRSKADLPIVSPAGNAWSVRVDDIQGPFALGLWRRQPKGFVFPNQVVEKALGVAATTRWWETILRLAQLIER